MFTRRVVFRVRADSSAGFTRIVEGRLLPQLRAQEGCRHEDTFITPEFSEAVINSYRDTAECAAVYARTAYPEGTKTLAGVTEEESRVETLQLSSLTFRRIVENRRGEYRTSQPRKG